MKQNLLNNIRHCLAFLVLINNIGTLSAQETQDSVRVYFHQGDTRLDLYLRENRKALDKLIPFFTDTHNADYRLRKISVIGAASPEGTIPLNKRLAEERARNLFQYISDGTNTATFLKDMTFTGRDWDRLITLVKGDAQVPYQSEVLCLLEEISTQDGMDGQDRLPELKRLQGGEPYMYMFKHLFPELRSSLVKIWYETVEKKNVTDTLRIIDTLRVHTRDTLFLRDTIVIRVPEEKRPFSMAVTTNMLYDALAVPNIGVEFYLGRNWSLTANWAYGWWKNNHRHYYWRIYGGELSLRHWFGKQATAHRSPLTGHHIGVYGQTVTYDFEFGGKGQMGGEPGGSLWDRASFGAGIAYGYSLPIARRLNIDFSIGLGYLGGKYYEYIPIDQCYVWQTTKQRHYWGPTKLEVSLVWLIGRENYNQKKEKQKQ